MIVIQTVVMDDSNGRETVIDTSTRIKQDISDISRLFH